MSKAEILKQLPTLTKAERHEVRLLLTKLDGEDWFESADLSDSEKALLDSRIAEYLANPAAVCTWEEVEAGVDAVLKEVNASRGSDSK